jgi:DNA polymerase III epsilon subunit-like protein
MTEKKSWKDDYGSILWVDVETAGLNPNKHPIIEAGLVFTDRKGIPQNWSKLPSKNSHEMVLTTGIKLKDTRNIDPAAMIANMQPINGVVRGSTTSASCLVDIWTDRFIRYVVDHCQEMKRRALATDGKLPGMWPVTVAGWNVAFDIRWLQVKAEINLFQFEDDSNYLEPGIIDVKPMTWVHMGQRLSLRPAYKEIMGKELPVEHSALEDAKATAEIYAEIIKTLD